ncbi:lasso peptide biosynthesis PqqD family chaperone [Cytobacillus purgationiresistens]|uniref:Metallophosphoesterase n=1 Tax=Cytobacillus purgationiresistens TaxID=863449 RepID=A0ABU0AI68_9BACI|nr:lasso peptide biosynthesis PqqD family chaperone [Cytobacillus purgationiresistens]MDQ0270917.1 hypothetical protein [Cytobacillus purgationiresistens]
MSTKKMVSLKDKVQQVKGNLVSDMGGEKVMLSIENGKYYNLGEIGGDIWELISEPIEIDQIVSKLMDHYEVTREECETEVTSFLAQLKKENLIQLKGDF